MNKGKVLVIDDDPFVLKSCKRVLESEQYLTTLCSSVQDAVYLLEKENFQLIIIDVVMPKYNQEDLAIKIKEEQADAKTLTMSGYVEPQAFSEMIKGKDVNFLPKPFTPEELLRAVEKTLNGD